MEDRRLIRLWRHLRNIILVLLTVTAVAVGYLTGTAPGRANLASIASSLASGGGRTVNISGIKGVWGGPITIQSIVVEDSKGPWLALRDVSADLSYRALIGKTVSAGKLSIGRVEVARTPEPGETAATESAGFSLPVDIDLPSIDIPEILVGEQLVGGVAKLRASGRVIAKAEPLHLDSKLDVMRVDGAGGELDLTVVFAPGEDRLDVQINGNEPQGGVVAQLLGLPGAPPISIAIEGTGPASNWQGQGAVAVDQKVVAKFRGTHRSTNSGSRLDLTGEGEFAQFLPEGLRHAAEGQSTITFGGTIGEDGAIDVEQASLVSARLDVKAQGKVDPATSSDFQLGATTLNGPLELAFGEGAERMSVMFEAVDAKVTGTGSKPAIDATMKLPSIVHPMAALRNATIYLSSEGFDVATRTGPVEIGVNASSATSPNASLAPFLAGPLAVQVKANVETGAILLSGATVENSVVNTTANGTISRTDGAASINVAGHVQRAAIPAAARGVVGETVQLETALARGADGALSLSNLKILSGPLAINGNASVTGGNMRAALDGTLADLSGAAPDVSGAIGFKLSADGPLLGPALKLDVTSDRIESGGRAITNLQMIGTATADAANPAADVSLTGQVGDQALKGAVKLATENGRSRISGLDLTLGQNRITGDLDLNSDFLPAGSVAFTLPDLGSLGALALQQISGSANGTVQFSNSANGPALEVDATVPQFQRDTISGRDLKITANVENYVVAPAVAGRIQAAGVNAGTTAVTGIDVALTRDGVWTGFDGQATANAIPAKATGRAKYENGVATVELTSGNATVQGVLASIAAPSTITNANGVTRIERLVLALGGGRATVSGTAGAQLAINAELAAVPVSLANNFVPGLGADGTVSGTVRVTGAPANPSIAYDVRATGAQTAQTRGAGFGAMAVDSTGTFANGALSFNATIGESGGLALRGGGTVQTTGSRAMRLKFDGTVPFGFLTRQLAQQGVALTGAANVAITVGGNSSSPVIGGTITSTGARFVDAQSGVAINDLATRIELGGGVARIVSMTGAISSGGALNASGTIGIDAGSGFPADLSIRISDGRFTDGRVVTANFGGDLFVKGPLTQTATLSGRINLGRTIITLPERIAPSLSKLNVKHKNAPADVARQAEALKPATSGGGGGGFLLDLEVAAQDQIFVRGRGLNAELGGSIRLIGPSASPEAVGSFKLRRGRLGILGRRLDFSQGNITFSGSLSPEVDFAATSNVDGGTVTVAVTGEASNPKFSFTSSPAAPEDEVFAQLVFGRAMGSLSAVQIAQLAQAAAQLAGVGGSTSLLDNLQGKLGVDDLDVKTDEETGDTSVSVGKYLNDRTYITIEKGSRPGSGKAAIDLNVGKGVKLRGEASDDGSTKGGIFYEKEY
jgi:translocation and assembly module TamB